MREYTHEATDIKSLIGQEIHASYQHQERDEEISQISDSEPLSCYFCKKEIRQDETINLHHPVYKSNGGTHVEPAHESCHVEFHSRKGDFREWGRQSALTRRWAFNLKNVKDNPAYDFDRAYYLMFYAQ